MINRILRKQSLQRQIIRSFSAFQNGASALERPAQDRVVSTPEWPVPYYQRLYRSYPVRDTTQPDLSAVGAQFDDSLVWFAKKEYSKTQEGRDVVTHVEDHIELDSKCPESRPNFWIFFIKKDNFLIASLLRNFIFLYVSYFFRLCYGSD